MNKRRFGYAFACIFWFTGTALSAPNASLDRIVTQIDSMLPPIEGVVVSINEQELILDLKEGQPIKPGDQLKLIRFGKDIVHPVSKKKIGRQETDLGTVEVTEVRRNFSKAKLLDSQVIVIAGDGVRSPFNKLSFLVTPPINKTAQKIDRNHLRLELEKTLAGHPRFEVPNFELDLWLLENNLGAKSLLNQNNLNKLSRLVKVNYLLVSSVESVKNKLVLSYKLYSAKTGQLQKQAKILSDQLLVKSLEHRPSPGKPSTHRKFASTVGGSVKYLSKQEFPFKIVDFDVGDINGDGREELVVIAPHRMIVYDFRNKKLKPVARFRAENENHDFLGVDVGDINNNGRDEIFITNQLGDSLSSFVLEAPPGKKRLHRVWTDINLYFRIIHPFGQNPTLLTQAPGFYDPFHGPIKKMFFKGRRYVNGSTLKLPSVHGVEFIIYGLTAADINGNNKDEFVVLDNDYHLRVYSTTGRLLVRSDDYYGHDPRVIDVGVRVDIADHVEQGEAVNYRGRLEFIRQGKHRYLLLPKNYSAGGKLMPGLAAIETSSSLAILRLSREGFKSAFETSKQRGYLAAYQVAKTEREGGLRLHLATVEEKAGSGKVFSTIYTYFWEN